MPDGQFSMTLKDYDGENTTTTFYTAELTALNFDAQVALKTAFGVAVADMVRGTGQRTSLGNVEPTPTDPPDDTWAQRELKWRIDYRDTITGVKRHITLGTANTARLNPNARGKAFIGDGAEVDAFVTALEAFMVSEAGNAIEVEEITLVGRNT